MSHDENDLMDDLAAPPDDETYDDAEDHYDTVEAPRQKRRGMGKPHLPRRARTRRSEKSFSDAIVLRLDNCAAGVVRRFDDALKFAHSLSPLIAATLMAMMFLFTGAPSIRVAIIGFVLATAIILVAGDIHLTNSNTDNVSLARIFVGFMLITGMTILTWRYNLWPGLLGGLLLYCVATPFAVQRESNTLKRREREALEEAEIVLQERSRRDRAKIEADQAAVTAELAAHKEITHGLLKVSSEGVAAAALANNLATHAEQLIERRVGVRLAEERMHLQTTADATVAAVHQEADQHRRRLQSQVDEHDAEAQAEVARIRAAAEQTQRSEPYPGSPTRPQNVVIQQ